MKQWSISKKLYLGTGALMFLIIAAGAFALNSLSTVQANMDKVAGVMSRRMYLVDELTASAEQAWAGEKGLIGSAAIKDTKNVDTYQDQEVQALKHISESAAELKTLLVIPASQADLATVQADLSVWQQTAPQVLALSRHGDFKKAQETSRDNIKPRYRNIVKLSKDMQARVLKMMSDTRDGADQQTGTLQTIMLGRALLSMVIGALLIWAVRGIVRTLRSTVTELSNGGDQVAAASSQIASTSQSLSQGSSEQAASLEEVSASMEEMTAMTRRNSENSSEATAMMTETVSQVGRSNAALQEMVASMGAIKQSSEKVARINKTIDEIAFQTNILALNAAVEAARAGEAGMGFAVVADEVRNLAQRSAVAAKDTAALIDEAISNSNQGAAKLEQVAVAIRAITDSAGKVKGLVDEVNEASKQQSQGINQVSTAVNQVSKVTQTAAASAEESAAAAQELSAQSETVSELVNLLRGLVEGAGHDITRKRPAVSESAKPERKRFNSSAAPAPAETSEDPFPMETSGSGNFRSF